MTTRAKIVGLVILLAGTPAGIARAQFDGGHPSNDGILVAGIGTAKTMPDRVKIEVRMQGKAEITDDALVKYHAAQKRLIEALEKLKMENLKFTERHVKLTSGGDNAMAGIFWGGGNNQNEAAASTEISGTLRVELTGLEKMPKDDVWTSIGKALDAIRDAGGGAGPSQSDIAMSWRFNRQMPSGTSVKFVLSDLKPLREQAYEKAVADARARADRLAKLNGIKVGRVTAVSETYVPGDGPQRNRFFFWGNDEEETEQDRDEIAVDTLSEIPVTVHLSVRFEIAPPEVKGTEVSAAGLPTKGPAETKVSTQ